MNKGIKNTLLAHVRAAKTSYGEVSNGKHVLEFGMFCIYILEFKFMVVNDIEQVELKLYGDGELLFWVMHKYNETFDMLVEYIEDNI